MIDARFIEAKRRAAKYFTRLGWGMGLTCRNTGDGPGAGGNRRRRHSHKGGATVSSTTPTARAPDAHNEHVTHGAGEALPRSDPIGLQRLSPHIPSAQPFTPLSVLQKDGHGGPPATSVIKLSPPMQSLEENTARLSIRDEPQSPKQGRQRGRNRGRSNMSKHSSPQRNFHARTSSEDQRVCTTQRSTGSHNDQTLFMEKVDTTRKGVLPISIPSKPSPKPENSLPVVRLPETVRPPASAASHDSMALIRSEDTDFGSYISRGAVQEGRLYNHKQVEKSHSPPKPRESKPQAPPPAEEKPQPRPGGLLRIQPRKVEPPKAAPGHRGGLLFIDTNAIKSTNNNKATKQRQNQSEYKRDAVPLRKEPESQARAVWNPDNIPHPEAMLHDGPKYDVSAEDILREVKSAYQEIQNLEHKVESIYDSQADGADIPRIRSRSQNDPVVWTKYCKTHNEYISII